MTKSNERENIFTIPNLLSVIRGILAPIVGYVIIQQQFTLAIGLLFVAGITDMLDGFIARTWKSQASKLGSFIDPLADKLLIGSLVLALYRCSLFPRWLTLLMVLRDTCHIISICIKRFHTLPSPVKSLLQNSFRLKYSIFFLLYQRSFARFCDLSLVAAKIEPTMAGKLNTALQLITIAASLGAPIWNYIGKCRSWSQLCFYY